eukprot:Sdes_comp19493_c0_seq1m11005
MMRETCLDSIRQNLLKETHLENGCSRNSCQTTSFYSSPLYYEQKEGIFNNSQIVAESGRTFWRDDSLNYRYKTESRFGVHPEKEQMILYENVNSVSFIIIMKTPIKNNSFPCHKFLPV